MTTPRLPQPSVPGPCSCLSLPLKHPVVIYNCQNMFIHSKNVFVFKKILGLLKSLVKTSFLINGVNSSTLSCFNNKSVSFNKEAPTTASDFVLALQSMCEHSTSSLSLDKSLQMTELDSGSKQSKRLSFNKVNHEQIPFL